MIFVAKQYDYDGGEVEYAGDDGEHATDLMKGSDDGIEVEVWNGYQLAYRISDRYGRVTVTGHSTTEAVDCCVFEMDDDGYKKALKYIKEMG